MVCRGRADGGARWLWSIRLLVGPQQPIYARIASFLTLACDGRVLAGLEEGRATLYFERLDEAAGFLEVYDVVAEGAGSIPLIKKEIDERQ